MGRRAGGFGVLGFRAGFRAGLGVSGLGLAIEALAGFGWLKNIMGLVARLPASGRKVEAPKGFLDLSYSLNS